MQGDQAARVGSSGAAIQNVLSFLNGGLLNELQYAGGGFAIDAALSLLEREGIAQSLSSPSLTVLSGELAQVQVGGEVPVPTAFAPAFGAAGDRGAGHAGGDARASSARSNSCPFGVQLQIRPLVGDDDTITLDVQPLVVTPDAVLTDAIRQSTGTAVADDGVPDPGAAHEFEAAGRPGAADRRAAVEQYVHKYGLDPGPAGRPDPRDGCSGASTGTTRTPS